MKLSTINRYLRLAFVELQINYNEEIPVEDREHSLYLRFPVMPFEFRFRR